jgi:hypothetical protein
MESGERVAFRSPSILVAGLLALMGGTMVAIGVMPFLSLGLKNWRSPLASALWLAAGFGALIAARLLVRRLKNSDWLYSRLALAGLFGIFTALLAFSVLVPFECIGGSGGSGVRQGALSCTSLLGFSVAPTEPGRLFSSLALAGGIVSGAVGLVVWLLLALPGYILARQPQT